MHWTSKSVDNWLYSAVKKVKDKLQAELRKFLPIVDLKQTPPFLEQIKVHYEKADDAPEMQQEKPWMLATLAIAATMKVKWLQQWNFPPSIRDALKFPKPVFSDVVFPPWLHKATWCAQVSLLSYFIFVLFCHYFH